MTNEASRERVTNDDVEPMLRVVLVTAFEESFLQQDTLPELARRGVEVVARFPASRVESYDLPRLKEHGVQLILHMVEKGSHSSSEKLSTLARTAGLPIRALSRKKASWTFLPPPRDEEATSRSGLRLVPEVDERKEGGVAEESWSEVLRQYEVFAGLVATEEARQYIRESGFNRRGAHLRDVVRLFVHGCGVRSEDQLLEVVRIGRDQQTFPRLYRLNAEKLPKLVRSMLAQELGQKCEPSEDESDDEGGPSSVREVEMHAITSTSESAKDEPSERSLEKEIIELRARVAQLERLEQAHEAMRSLVRLGYMTAAEAAERLFAERG